MSTDAQEYPDVIEVIAYTLNDAAKVCGLGRSTIYELIGKGDIDAVKAGGRTLVTAASLRNYIAGLPAVNTRKTA